MSSIQKNPDEKPTKRFVSVICRFCLVYAVVVALILSLFMLNPDASFSLAKRDFHATILGPTPMLRTNPTNL